MGAYGSYGSDMDECCSCSPGPSVLDIRAEAYRDLQQEISQIKNPTGKQIIRLIKQHLAMIKEAKQLNEDNG